jgi:hypothetical protein
MQIINRLKRLEKRTAAVGIPLDIVDIIDTAYYDELTEGQKNSYCKYWNMDREAAENLQMYVNGTLHIKLERRPAHEMTPAEREAAEREAASYVETWFKECQERYAKEHKA